MKNCPAPDALLAYALSGGDGAVERHAPRCATCQAEISRLRQTAEALRATPPLDTDRRTLECLDELAIADFIDGRLLGAAREEAVNHLASCPRCRYLVVGAARLMSQPAVEASIRGRRWRPWFPAALAAAAVVTVIVWPQRAAQETPSVLRDLPPQDSARFAPSPRPSVAQAQPNPSSSRLIVPRGRVVRAESFVWRPVSGAERYRLWLYDAEGTVLWTTVTPDTLVARPDSVPLATGQAYFWKVDAQVEWPRWISSPLVEFLVTGPSP